MVDELEDQLSESRIGGGGGGKLLIKLKNVAMKDEGYEVCGENEKKITRICQVCSKEFSSGKALGGHMRIHGQQYKKRRKDYVVEDEEEEKEEEEVVIHGEIKKKKKWRTKKMKMAVPVCSICGKDFQSMKSLYGHMRSHPRDWRGIQPPPPAENPVVSGGGVVDLKMAVMGWSVTAKRGRKVVSCGGGDQTSSLSDDTEEGELQDAAHELMMLAHGRRSPPHNEEFDSNSLDHEHEGRKNYWDNFDFTTTKSSGFSVGNQKLGIGGGNSRNFRSKSSLVVAKNVRGKAKATPENKESAGYEAAENSSDGGGESKKLNSGYWESSFNSRANERSRKKKVKLIKLRDLGSVQNAAAAVDHDDRSPPPVAAPPRPVAEKYKCIRCDKCFPSYQALGGHNSSHNKFKVVIQDYVDDSNSPGELSHTGAAASAAGQHQILDFDLNEVPHTEEIDAAADDHHCGYASNSFTSMR